MTDQATDRVCVLGYGDPTHSRHMEYDSDSEFDGDGGDEMGNDTGTLVEA